MHDTHGAILMAVSGIFYSLQSVYWTFWIVHMYENCTGAIHVKYWFRSFGIQNYTCRCEQLVQLHWLLRILQYTLTLWALLIG